MISQLMNKDTAGVLGVCLGAILWAAEKGFSPWVIGSAAALGVAYIAKEAIVTKAKIEKGVADG